MTVTTIITTAAARPQQPVTEIAHVEAALRHELRRYGKKRATRAAENPFSSQGRALGPLGVALDLIANEESVK
jgi:hypothetical protein